MREALLPELVVKVYITRSIFCAASTVARAWRLIFVAHQVFMELETPHQLCAVRQVISVAHCREQRNDVSALR